MALRPALLGILPGRFREHAYFRRYHTRHAAWRQLFARAPLALCSEIAMYDLIPGDVISGCIAFNGFYEWGLAKLIAQHAAKGGLLVDVGANMGYFSLLWAGLNRSNKVVAFEASPRNVELLRNNVKKNHLEDRIAVVPKAAGDHAGAVPFEAGAVEQTGWGGISAGSSATSISVPMARLDDYLPDTQIDVLKIDTEGADTLVLFGCENLLKNRKIKVIYFEQNRSRMQQIGLAEGEAPQFLQSLGYQCYCIGGSEEEWVAYSA
jgi:FkbM family methyltransferase